MGKQNMDSMRNKGSQNDLIEDCRSRNQTVISLRCSKRRRDEKFDTKPKKYSLTLVKWTQRI
jgi:hypothetical protein